MHLDSDDNARRFWPFSTRALSVQNLGVARLVFFFLRIAREREPDRSEGGGCVFSEGRDFAVCCDSPKSLPRTLVFVCPSHVEGRCDVFQCC